MERRAARSSSIAQEETRIGLLVDGGETVRPDKRTIPLPRVLSPSLAHPRPAWIEDEPATVCEYRELPLPKAVKVPSKPALRPVPSAPRIPAPVVKEVSDDTEAPLVLRVSSEPFVASVDKTAPRKIADRTAPVRSFRDRLPAAIPSRVRGLDPTRSPVPAAPRSAPRKARTPGPEDTILEGSPQSAALARSAPAGFYEVSPHRSVLAILAPERRRSPLARAETHFVSDAPPRTITFASVTLSICIGVLITLAVLYQVL
jgi:hypothetical protein